jgi:hypothetical protein
MVNLELRLEVSCLGFKKAYLCKERWINPSRNYQERFSSTPGSWVWGLLWQSILSYIPFDQGFQLKFCPETYIIKDWCPIVLRILFPMESVWWVISALDRNLCWLNKMKRKWMLQPGVCFFYHRLDEDMLRLIYNFNINVEWQLQLPWWIQDCNWLHLTMQQRWLDHDWSFLQPCRTCLSM